MSSNLWKRAVPCHEPNANIPVPVHYAKQSVLYRSIKQNHKVVQKIFSYHFNMSPRSIPGTNSQFSTMKAQASAAKVSGSFFAAGKAFTMLSPVGITNRNVSFLAQSWCHPFVHLFINSLRKIASSEHHLHPRFDNLLGLPGALDTTCLFCKNPCIAIFYTSLRDIFTVLPFLW